MSEVLKKFNIVVQLKWPNDVLKDGKKTGRHPDRNDYGKKPVR